MIRVVSGAVETTTFNSTGNADLAWSIAADQLDIDLNNNFNQFGSSLTHSVSIILQHFPRTAIAWLPGSGLGKATDRQ